MIITDITTQTEVHPGFGKSGLPRSVGDRVVHVTEVLDKLDEVSGGGKKYSERGFDLQMCGELGFCWEDALEGAYAGRYKWERPGEVWKDGIVGSPDGLEPGVRVHEIKLRWKSLRNFDLKSEEKILMQAKSYCVMTGVRECWFHVGFVMASWGYGELGEPKEIGPVRKVWKCEWGKVELWEHWKMMRRGRDMVLEDRARGLL